MPDHAATRDAHASYLRALIRFSATPPVDRVPRLLRLDDEAAAVLAELIDAGLVEVWDQRAPAGRPRAVLTCLGAERLGVQLIEVQGSIVAARWGRHGEDPGPRRAPAVTATDYAAGGGLWDGAHALDPALAEFEREMIIERTRAGMAAARARGRNGGRPYIMTAEKLRLAMAAMSSRDTKVGVLCSELGITRQTLYRHLDPTGNLRPDGQKLLNRQKPATKIG